MHHAVSRFLSALASAALLVTSAAAQAPAAPPAVPWLFQGSDLPVDTHWRFGVLGNGLRYAVRQNKTPEDTVSIRVRIDAGALNERPDEAGYAHFIEHMTFRGTKSVPDGEGIRTWQRLGARFGVDSNATTMPTQTVYQLDLPKNDPAALDTALTLVSEMVSSANIDPTLVDIERKVVIAEREMRVPPLTRRIQDLAKVTVTSGTRAATMDLAGTDASLNAATAERLRAFYHRWYRPERTTVVLCGDADAAALEAAVERHFGAWQGLGPAPADPDYGKPVRPKVPEMVVSDPQAPSQLALIWVTPHDDRPDTYASESADLVRDVAVQILSQRIARMARTGAAFSSGGAGFGEQRHVQDEMTVSVTPKAGQWRQALEQLYGILADAGATVPDQSEIDEVASLYESGLQAGAASISTARSPAFANSLIRAVDTGEVVAEPDVILAVFEKQRKVLTPQNVGAALRTLIQGDQRAVLLSPQPVEGGDVAFAQALAAARSVKAVARTAEKNVSLDDLGRLGTPGRIVTRRTIPDLGITRVTFANGLELDVKPTDFDKDQVYVQAMVGDGLLAFDGTQPTLQWTAPAILQGGVGPFDLTQLQHALAGKRIGLSFGVGDRAFTWSGATNAGQLKDQLRLLDAAIREPRFDPDAFARVRDSYAQDYESLYSSPGSVFRFYAAAPLHRGDQRFANPSLAQLGATTAEAFRAFWQPLFANGPRKLTIVGDVDADRAIELARQIFGASSTRPNPRVSAKHLAVLPPRPGTPPLTLDHKGSPEQMVVATAWSTTGGLTDLPQLRALNVAAQIMETRLYDRFREAEGGTYSPSVSNGQSDLFPRYGVFLAYSQLRPELAPDFDRATQAIAHDLATKGPTADEVARATQPIVSSNERSRRTNAYWAAMMAGDLDDPRYVTLIRTGVSGYQAVTADQIRKAAARWLSRPPSLRIMVKGSAR